MLRHLGKETIVSGFLLTTVLALSLLAYLLLTPDSPTSAPSNGQHSSQQEPGFNSWEPTGQYRTEQLGIGLTVHAYTITPDYLAILYSLDSSQPGVSVAPDTVALTDDIGQTYVVRSNTVFGSSLGVTAGVITAEPYKGQGKMLSLTVTDVSLSASGRTPSETLPGIWKVNFIETRFPGAPVTYVEGGRIAPEITSAGDLTMAVAGQPGGRFIKLLIDRAGKQDALYALISNGLARPLTETQFRQQLKASPFAVDDFPPPYDWPTPAALP